MAERDKVSGFRLPMGILEKLDDLIERGIIKNRTDGVINAIEMLYDSEQYDTKTGRITDLISWATGFTKIASEWHLFPVGTMFPIFNKNGDRTILTKLGTDKVELVRDVNGHRLIISAQGGDVGIGIASEKYYSFLVQGDDMSKEEIDKANIKLLNEIRRKEHAEKKK